MSLSLISVFSLIEISSSLHTIQCNSMTPCNSPIQCNTEEDCAITCGDSACIDRTITCPINGACTIQCAGYEACWNATISAPQNGNFDLSCHSIGSNGNPHGKICANITVYGSTLPSSQNTDHFNVLCGNDIHSCLSAEINCPQATDCEITCNSTASCKQATINGPISHQLTVKCDGPSSCKHTEINAAFSSITSITGCTQPNSCKDLTLYCPQHTQTKNCYLQGNDNLANTQIYALNGWNDIDIQYNGTFINAGSTGSGSTMHCGDDYTQLCNILNNEWNCSNNQCVPTSMPTVSPSINPTLIPTISPSIKTTMNPSLKPTANPSLKPTVNPTLKPTENPSLKPTVKPTVNPTLIPTLNPTLIPTLKPTVNPTVKPTLIPTFAPLTAMPTTPGLHITNKPSYYGESGVKDETTSYLDYESEINVIGNKHNNTTLIIILICGVFGFIICSIIVFCFVYHKTKNKSNITTEKQNKKPRKHHSKLHSKSSYSTHIHMDYTIGSTEMAQIPEKIDNSHPIRLNSDDIIYDGLDIKKYKNSLAPSYASQIMESVHNDDEVLASDDENDGSNDSMGSNVYKFNTPTGNKSNDDEIYNNRMNNVNNIKELPQLHKIQSEGGEEYHNKMKLEGQKSKSISKKCNIIIKIPHINVDEYMENEDDNYNTPIGDQNEDDIITPYDDDNGLDIENKMAQLSAIHENRKNNSIENDINFLNNAMSDDIIVGDDENEIIETPKNDNENDICIGNYADIIKVKI